MQVDSSTLSFFFFIGLSWIDIERKPLRFSTKIKINVIKNIFDFSYNQKLKSVLEGMDFNVCYQSFIFPLYEKLLLFKNFERPLSLQFSFLPFIEGGKRDTLTSMAEFQTVWAIRKFFKKIAFLYAKIS